MSGGSAEEGTETVLTVNTPGDRLAAVATGLEDMEKSSGTLLIKNDADKHLATEMIGKAKRLAKLIEDKRVEIYDGLYPVENRKVVKTSNDLAKGYKRRLDLVSIGLEQKYLAFDREVREAAALEEARRIQAERKAKYELEEKAKFLPPDVEVPKFIEPVTHMRPSVVSNITRSDNAASYKKKVKGFKIIDFSLVPDEYKEICVVDVRREMNKKDRKDIPGIKWTEDEKLATRLK